MKKLITLAVLFTVVICIKTRYDFHNPNLPCYSLLLLKEEFNNEPELVTVVVTDNYIASNGVEVIEFSQVGDLTDKVKFSLCNNEEFTIMQKINLNKNEK